MSDKTADIAITESKSTAIVAHGYDRASQKMVLVFNGGRRYTYADVPAETYEALKSAKSMGQFYGTHINGKFKAI